MNGFVTSRAALARSMVPSLLRVILETSFIDIVSSFLLHRYWSLENRLPAIFSTGR
jgi:hypothetical protein